MNYRFSCLNGTMLKWIAIVTMVIDHVGAILFPEIEILRYIGRIAFPLFAFLLVEGYIHTSNVKKYMGRLLIFALISEIPFDIALYSETFYWGHQNIFWTLLLGVLVLFLVDRLPQRWMGFLAGVAIIILAQVVNTDYAAGGVILIFILYFFRKKPLIKFICMAVIFGLGYGSTQLFGLIAILPMLLYNGQRGKYSLKYFFYVFYPCHLLVLQVIWLKVFVSVW